MNIHRAAHYLNWDFPPHYRAPYNVITFVHEAVKVSKGKISDSDIYHLSNMWIRGTDMYRSVLQLLTYKQQITLLQSCIPHDIYFDIVWATIDTRYMPSSLWSDYQWKVQTTVTRDPDDPRKITSLHTKFLPIMNAYNTLVLKKDSSNHTTTNKKVKVSELVVLAFEVRIGRSGDNVRAEMLRLIPEDYDVDDLDIMIQEIF